MTLEVNPHVLRLRGFQPFQTGSAELVYEHTKPGDRHFEPVTLGFLEMLIEDGDVRLVVLTGDAGHGKTTLCARVLERLGLDSVEAHRAIRQRGHGVEEVARTHSGRSLRLLSDLSESPRESAAPLLARLVDTPPDAVTIICANEGHLRNCVSADVTGRSQVIIETLVDGIEFGTVANQQSGVCVINLNFQSTAPDQGDGLVDWAIREWAADGRRWRPCQRCEARHVCPIYANHQSLSDSERGTMRRGGIRSLFSTAERMGSVITTRQALAAISYAVTGGLTCQDVHRKYTRGQGNVWQYPHLYHQAIFADLLSASNRGQVPAFSSLRQLDPGSVSLREFDDQLEPDDVPITFLPPKLNDDQSVRSRREALRQSDLMKSHIGFLRRFEFFESGTDHARRMGLLSGTEFVEIATGSAPRVEVRDTLLRGLEAVQGVRRPGESPDFLVLDPAFFSHRNRAAVISARVQGINVNVKSHVQHWAESCTEQPIMPIAVEWSSRTVYLKISGSSGNVTIPLNLMLFELLRRWAGGLTTRGQYEGEIRSLTRLLATLAPPESGTDEIEVLVNGERRSLTIDVGDRIRSGGL